MPSELLTLIIIKIPLYKCVDLCFNPLAILYNVKDISTVPSKLYYLLSDIFVSFVRLTVSKHHYDTFFHPHVNIRLHASTI